MEAGTELARVALLVGDGGELALGAATADRGDYKAVRLLHGQADEGLNGGDFGGCAKAAVPLFVATIVHSQGAQGRIAALQRRVGIDAAGTTGGTGGGGGGVASGNAATTGGDTGCQSQSGEQSQKTQGRFTHEECFLSNCQRSKQRE